MPCSSCSTLHRVNPKEKKSEIINCKDSGSVYNVDIFAMYEEAYSHQNMAKVLQMFLQDIEGMHSTSFSLY